MMDVYGYIAQNNPFLARSIIESFGYKVTSRDMSNNLRELVKAEGEPALIRIMENHPDKDYILELFSEKPTPIKQSNNDNMAYLQYMNASGNSEATKYGLQTNTFLLASALILAVAIISKN